MLLNPRYGTDPILTLDGDPAAIAAPATRQRRRLVDTLAAFIADDWAHPSRCAGWSSHDVIVHLDGTNFFWTQTIAAALRGERTQFLATFDPVESPARAVANSHGQTNDDVLERFAASTTTFVDLLESLTPDDWSRLAEAPPGHLTISAVVHHALWDSWIHERDVLLPLRLDAPIEDDEVAACLRYVSALGPALSLTRGSTDRGRLRIVATEPDISFIVEMTEHVHVVTGHGEADLELTGSAAELVDALSVRRPLDQPVPAAMTWLLAGLLETFDQSDDR